MEERSIEETFLKGITPKLLWGFIAGWSSILITILLTYGSIKSEFQIQDNSNKIQDLRLNLNDTHDNTVDLQIKSLQEQINELRNSVSVLQAEKKTQ